MHAERAEKEREKLPEKPHSPTFTETFFRHYFICFASLRLHFFPSLGKIIQNLRKSSEIIACSSELLDIWVLTASQSVLCRSKCKVDFQLILRALYEVARLFVMMSVWLLCCVLNLLTKERPKNGRKWWCRARTRTRSKCAWWLSIIIRNYIIAVDGKFFCCRICYLAVQNKFLIKFYDILTALRKILRLFSYDTYNNTNLTIIFYERWEIENKIELCENCWTQKMRFLDRISVYDLEEWQKQFQA